MEDDLERPDAVIAWEGDSKEVISGFPEEVKENLGFQLRLLQRGEQPTDYRPMPSIARGYSSCEMRMHGHGTG